MSSLFDIGQQRLAFEVSRSESVEWQGTRSTRTHVSIDENQDCGCFEVGMITRQARSRRLFAVCISFKPPTFHDLDEVAQKIAARVSRYLEKAGYLIRDAESDYLDLYGDAEDAMSSIVGTSISYRMAFGPNAGKKLERVCRYITRPVIAEQRVSLTGHSNVVVELKPPYDDGTTHVILSPMEF
ncbi:MAG: hypothetical protein ACI805_002532, partial [Candidatus Azotimanducaceae bacterium]